MEVTSRRFSSNETTPDIALTALLGLPTVTATDKGLPTS
jgi:hypothetical protein